MCGICGIINKNGKAVDFKILKEMNQKLLHRGPDDEGYFVKENIAVAMRRLSIIDINTGHQPIFNEDNTIGIVFNGEIYNFLELKEELQKKGHIFKTSSDTEVIVHLYEEEGEEFVEKLRGMFAFAIVDMKGRKLILARDRFGKKPLYYFEDPEVFVFSSELNSLIAHPRVKKEINLEAVNIYLTLQYIPSPHTIYKGISKLKPAHILTLNFDGKRSIKRYWELEKKTLNIEFDEAKEMLRKLLFDAVRIRMIADVEIGAFLSGGIDSSIVVGIMSQISTKPLKTFSIGFKEKDFSELDYAKKIAERFSTHHNQLIISDRMIDIVEDIPKIYGEPFADPSALPTYYVAKTTSKHLKVALNGDGGDEAFGGYIRYLFIKEAEALKKAKLDIPARILHNIIKDLPEGDAPFDTMWKFKKAVKALQEGDIDDAYISSVSFFSPSEKKRYLTQHFLSFFPSDPAYSYLKSFLNTIEGDILKRVSYLDYNTYLPEGLMTKMDRASMANSLETRSPFLDHKLVEFAFQLPSRYKIKGFKTKYILKEAFSDLLPKEIKRRGKMGFGIPLGPWFRNELKKTFEENCIKDSFITRGYFKKEELLRLWEEHQRFKKDNGYKLWTILILELWHKIYLDDFKL